MVNTYTQIHIQAIFAVQNRQCLIDKKWEAELYKYITGIIQKHDHKKQSFVDEYLHLLKEFEVDFDERYIFKPVL